MLRNLYSAKAKIVVLTNATTLSKSKIKMALEMVDKAVLKLDAGTEKAYKYINVPVGEYSYETLIENLKKFGRGKILQTLFLKGNVGGKKIDNTNGEEVKKWVEIIKEIQPKEVMIYTIARETAIKGLEKIDATILNNIASLLDGTDIKATVV
jgi:wyosine [tRNA(Phe)-imidazoG37] synthetase (radical SAM superfamily)